MGILFKDLVNRVFPELKIDKIKKIGEGDTYVAFLINDHYLFKQAKTDKARQQLKKEILLMDFLAGSFYIPIPRFILVENNYLFGAYEILKGIPLTEYLEKHEFTKSHADQINNFLATLHGKSFRTLKECALPIMDYFEEYGHDYEFIKRVSESIFSKRQKKIILEKYGSYLSCKNNFEYKPQLLHNDFSFNHIICDPESGNIRGVIDFGDAAIGDAAYDFYFLYELPESLFMEQICKFHPECNSEFINRIQFYSFANVMQILIETYKEKNEQLINLEKINVQKWFNIHSQSIDF
ncbi:MAG: aminoglycoside phosphotransferase family protein [Ginsengibacter sp.]